MYSKNTVNTQSASHTSSETIPASKIKVTFSIEYLLPKNTIIQDAPGPRFSFHFQTSDQGQDTLSVANQLMDSLLTSDYKKGIFSADSRLKKFNLLRERWAEDSFDFRYCISPAGVFDHLYQNGTASIVFGFITCNRCPYDTPSGFLIMLSMLDDGISLLKKSGCDIGFTVFDIMKKIAELCKGKEALITKHYGPDNNPILLNQLITFIEENPNTSYRDAILLYYCLASLDLYKPNIYGREPSFCQTPSLNTIDDLLKIIDAMACQYTSNKYWNHRYLSYDLRPFVDRFNLCNKIKLFSNALGNRSEDGRIYSWLSPEWSFLTHAQFEIDDVKQVVINPVIIDLPCFYSGYAMYYALERSFHPLFNQHLKDLELHGKIGFSLEESGDLHRLIRFTEESSKKLIAMQLPSNEPFVKQALRTRNNNRFFKPSNLEDSPLKILPMDIINLISALVWFKAGPRKLIKLEEESHQERLFA